MHWKYFGKFNTCIKSNRCDIDYTTTLNHFWCRLMILISFIFRVQNENHTNLNKALGMNILQEVLQTWTKTIFYSEKWYAKQLSLYVRQNCNILQNEAKSISSWCFVISSLSTLCHWIQTVILWIWLFFGLCSGWMNWNPNVKKLMFSNLFLFFC